MPGIDVSSVGDYIREQRHSAAISLRQLADLAGVSNPYLSQIERGLRKPSAEILQQIAKGLRISAETLYVRAGILDDRQGDVEVATVILDDPGLSDRQKRVLLDIYESFRRENAAAAAAADAVARAGAEEEHEASRPQPTRRTTSRARASSPDDTDGTSASTDAAAGAPASTDAAAGAPADKQPSTTARRTATRRTTTRRTGTRSTS